MMSRKSWTVLGQPWVTTNPTASGSGERTCRKWMPDGGGHRNSRTTPFDPLDKPSHWTMPIQRRW
jgi:hypothetical protein